MYDETENIRRSMVNEINSAAREETKESLREKLEREYGAGNVWDNSQLSATFEVLGFMAPFCVVRRMSNGVTGSVQFSHSPRLYYGLVAD